MSVLSEELVASVLPSGENATEKILSPGTCPSMVFRTTPVRGSRNLRPLWRPVNSIRPSGEKAMHPTPWSPWSHISRPVATSQIMVSYNHPTARYFPSGENDMQYEAVGVLGSLPGANVNDLLPVEVFQSCTFHPKEPVASIEPSGDKARWSPGQVGDLSSNLPRDRSHRWGFDSCQLLMSSVLPSGLKANEGHDPGPSPAGPAKGRGPVAGDREASPTLMSSRS